MIEKIKIVNWDILLAKEDIIVQSVNCQGVMGAGLAKQLASKYPKMVSAYKDMCRDMSRRVDLLGQVYWYFHEDGKIVANIFGQFGYGKGVQTNTDALLSGFLSVSSLARRRKLTVAIPYGIGCGLGSGNWDEILPMIESNRTFVNKYTTLYRYG